MTCGSSASENCTYFTSTGVTTSSTSSTSCTLTVCKSDSSVCQLRLDFDGFTTAGPLTVTTLTTKIPVAAAADAKLVNSVGNCIIDRFIVQSPGNKNPPTICGTSTGDHMYVDAGDSCSTLQYLRSTSDTTTASFTIKITQVECTSKRKAPDSCTQYHTAASGTVNSYNYQSGEGTGVHLGSQDFAICIRAERGACTICYSAADTDFQMSDIIANPMDSSCGNYAGGGAVGGQNDYILIPGGTCSPAGDSIFSADKYCGTSLQCPGITIGVASLVAANAEFQTVCTMNKPFKINVITDDTEAAEAGSEGQLAVNGGFNQGFRLDYWQTTLCLGLPN